MESRPGGSANSPGNNEHSDKAPWPRENHTFEGGSPVFYLEKCTFLSGPFLSFRHFPLFFSRKCSFWSALLGGLPVFLKGKVHILFHSLSISFNFFHFLFIFFHFRSFSFVFFRLLFIFIHFHSFSFIFIQFHSFSFIFFSFLSFSFHFLFIFFSFSFIFFHFLSCVCVVCGAWCVWFGTLKNPCVHSTRPRILTRCWVHLLSPIFCLPKFAHIRDITCFRGSPKKPLDLTFFENGASSIIERSALARCNVLIMRKRNTLQTICSATFAPFLSSSFYFSMTQ